MDADDLFFYVFMICGFSVPMVTVCIALLLNL